CGQMRLRWLGAWWLLTTAHWEWLVFGKRMKRMLPRESSGSGRTARPLKRRVTIGKPSESASPFGHGKGKAA
ncbi:MAG: hypothetical protein, partial [Olavius algarvensis Gamma 1 endosymbiont]